MSLNRNCFQVPGPCTCGAWHTDEEIKEMTTPDEDVPATPTRAEMDLVIGPAMCAAMARSVEDVRSMTPSEMIKDIRGEMGHGPNNPWKDAEPAQEFTREMLFTLHHQLTQEAIAIMRKKNADYSKNGPFMNFMMCEARGTATAEAGVLIRLDDKISRLNTLITRDAEVSDESFDDTCKDIINYVVCLAGLRKSRGMK